MDEEQTTWPLYDFIGYRPVRDVALESIETKCERQGSSYHCPLWEEKKK